ncbi:hypothetical protein FE392_19705 [Xenorhabdus sp. 12]|uniref:Uncharacterized protein n=1 Tax=Xenorhabdus santafensis TaxID=2582833 RepID=A0ABU4SF95_9GAMM|nr:hypothetical protein [Xenorhabdus sp. 12]MDX7989480.1 hypothetical protein [Xenorhabdus sp. 12]
MANNISLPDYFEYLSTGRFFRDGGYHNNPSGAFIQEYQKPDGYTSLCINVERSQLVNPYSPLEDASAVHSRLVRLGFISTQKGGLTNYRKYGKRVLWPRHQCNITINAYRHVLVQKLATSPINSCRAFEALVSNEAIKKQLNDFSQNGANPAQQPFVSQQQQQEQMRREIREYGWQNGFRPTTPLRPFFSPSRSPTPPSTPWTDASGNEWTTYNDYPPRTPSPKR